MNCITQGLIAEGCRVKVLSVCSEKHPVRQEQMTDEYVRQTDFEAVAIDLAVHPLDALVAMLCGESYHVKRYIDRHFEQRLIEVLNTESFDVVHVESIFLTPYLTTIRQHSHAAVVLRAHNVEHQIWQRIAKIERNPLKRGYLKHLSLTLGNYEREHASLYDGIACITQNDADYFSSLGCRKPIATIPFGIVPEPMANVDEEPYSLFHLGSMDWMPNEESIRWFLDKVWPTVHRRVPQARLYLAGRKMPQDLIDGEWEGVSVVGEVPDALYFISSKQINVVPLLSGSGIRVKIIEAMSQGKAVVSTTVGAQGIDYANGENLLIADTAEQFAEQIARCVEDQDYCHRIGQNAYNLVATRYNTQQLTHDLMAFYNRLTAKH